MTVMIVIMMTTSPVLQRPTAGSARHTGRSKGNEENEGRWKQVGTTHIWTYGRRTQWRRAYTHAEHAEHHESKDARQTESGRHLGTTLEKSFVESMPAHISALGCGFLTARTNDKEFPDCWKPSENLHLVEAQKGWPLRILVLSAL